jgi:Rho termination factor, N-terminal domain
MAQVRAKGKAKSGEALRVSEDFEQQPNDEVVAAGEQFPDFDEVELPTTAGGGTPHVGVLEEPPSERNLPYMSPEEQHMEMVPQVVGPPQYGSPDPLTSSGRLRTLDQHPLSARNLPEGLETSAAISEDYGQDVQGVTLPSPAEGGTQTGYGADPQNRQDLPSDIYLEASGTETPTDYESMSVEQLKGLARDREITGFSKMNKDQLIEELQTSDESSAEEEPQA